MWSKVALVLIALLGWDAVTSDKGESTLSRGGEALMAIGPVRDFTDYLWDGKALEDVKALSGRILAGTGDATKVVVALEATPEQQAAERAARRAEREKRRAEMRLSPDDVAKIAEAVSELYRKEKEEAEKLPPQAANMPVPSEPAPSEAVVEQSVASLEPDLLGAIVKASNETGANSGYLLHIALRESGLRLGAAAPTSSATGPFQFIAQTWYQMLGTYGAKHGLDAEVALLKKSSSGSFSPVSDEARVELLALRTDPYVAALMAGELTMENSATLTKLLGRAPAHGELYAAHVFGASGAAKLVKTRDTSASTIAAVILPSAAAANRWLFYTSSGQARTVTALFDELSRFMTTREVATVCQANLNFF
jgi:hypothetical protein